MLESAVVTFDAQLDSHIIPSIPMVYTEAPAGLPVGKARSLSPSTREGCGLRDGSAEAVKLTESAETASMTAAKRRTGEADIIERAAWHERSAITPALCMIGADGDGSA